ncbi:MAE_28990/MAE_18760 family HEPN-like nuclease [Aeromonas media]
MFDTTEQEIRDRVRQSKEILALISKLEGGDTSKLEKDAGEVDAIKIQKGFLFVSLYSSVEYSLTASAACFLTQLKIQKRKPLEYHRYMLCTILNADFNSIRDCSKKNLWDKKSDFLDALFSDEPSEIDVSIFPSDGINISDKQIKDVWYFFNLPGNYLPENNVRLILGEVKEHRNAIAHGREKAINIGSRYTLETLKKKEEDIEKICFHIINGFKTAFLSSAFLANNGIAS